MSTSAHTLAVVEATRFRGHDPAYHVYAQLLVGAVLARAAEAGWTVTRTAADRGASVVLDRTAGADAVVIVGGEDIAPRFYGGPSGYANEGRYLETADAAQIALVRQAVERSVPLLGICRGLQIVNVALGGTLVQDLGDGIHVNRGAPVPDTLTDHAVLLESGSRVEALLGPVARVRSAHHQAVDALGAGLVVAGRAPDGHIEAIEHDSAPILAVQWHPEDPGAPAGQMAARPGARRRVSTVAVRSCAAGDEGALPAGPRSRSVTAPPSWLEEGPGGRGGEEAVSPEGPCVLHQPVEGGVQVRVEALT
ncbi:gamma-glutamyl-gamma-aminobutyrate hydrolase family protein [Leifsonia xyli]|uniref:gamma-glutamyl-gamma-aminobutyrate hydrolase family protein n=1 Tax=Leifsonia xyli TaxID=1575 RepID=UPI001CB7E6F7|nr:gamma-glutamyl-gamma-aminobutyrate hydrolase family protein [Leifsonia xyli]